MKTIEERIGLCEHCLTDETRFCHTDCHLYSKYKGAAEQREIDIDKACEWLKTYCGMNESGLVHFRKAMEE